MKPIDQIAQILIAVIGGGAGGILIKSLFDRRKTNSEAEKNEADGEAVTIEALRKLQVDLLAQIQALAGHVMALQNTNAQLMLTNAENSVKLAIQQEQNRKLAEEVERLQQHVALLEQKK